jgi:sigma-B regulation protein RsbU (phosphoserine phosphatase)
MAIEGNQVRDKIFWVPAPNPSARGAWVSANATPLLNPNGTQHGGVLVLRDITNRKQALEFSERMNNAVELTDDSVFITDQSGVIQYINAAFAKTTGFSREEALGKTPRILKSFLNPPGHYKELWSTILGGRVFRKMVINRKKSGEIYYADQTITPMRDLSGRITHFVSVVKDMTEYRLMRQREVEMEIAVKVQKSLFPSDPPLMEHLDIAGAVFSADATCGDYFDYIPMLGNRVCLVVGDVSGHGIGPALVMAETRAYVRSLSPDDYSPGEILSKVNRILVEDLKGNHFVTLILAYVDADSGRLVYSSAGHDTCFLIDHTGHIKHELNSTGLPLGMFELRDYPTRQEIGFQKGDILFLLTDGLSDCQADQDRFLDIQGCLSLIHRHRSEPAKVIIKKIYEHARNFMGEESQNDDITMLICKADK